MDIYVNPGQGTLEAMERPEPGTYFKNRAVMGSLQLGWLAYYVVYPQDWILCVMYFGGPRTQIPAFGRVMRR